MADFALPVAFRFTVTVDDASGPEDAAFSEVTGLESEIELETVTEGGENRFVHKLPKAVKHPNLVLKRGVASDQGALAKWCKAVLENDFSTAITPRNVVISLCDEEGDPLRSWSISSAYPVKWSVSGFDAMKNEIVVETLEFAFNTLRRKA